MAVRVQHEDFDLGTEVAALRGQRADAGAVLAFVGTVRDLDDGGAIAQLELEHYPGMTEAALEGIAGKAMQRWPVLDVLVVHRIGALRACEQIVLVAVAARHRGDAFAACEYIMDHLKTRAPFWKKEHGVQGARWVEARAHDERSLARWEPRADGAARAAQP